MENYTFIDALYKTVITIATIGYHEGKPYLKQVRYLI